MTKIIDQTPLQLDQQPDEVPAATSTPAPPTSAPAVAAPAGGGAPDPFDPAQFAANSTVLGGIGVTKELVICAVRRPNKQEFVRVHPGPEFRLRAHTAGQL